MNESSTTLWRSPRALGVLTILIVAAALAFASDASEVTAANSSPTLQARTEAAVENGALATRALQDLGTWQGDCWPWVKRIVGEALGLQMGFGYRDGYLQAGATEVTAAEARNGDVVQLVDDSNAGPNASYPGLHTAIVLENYGDGTYQVIDSNRRWDGIVTTHRYNPQESADRYSNINVHFWRFPDTGGFVPSGGGDDGGDDGGDSVAAASLEAGDLALVSAGGDCLNLRAAPTTSSAVWRCLPDGSVVEVRAGLIESESYTWREVQASGQTGWVAQEFLAALGGGGGASSPPPTASPTAAPSGTSTPTPAPTPTPTATPLPAAETGASGAITAGDVPTGGGVGLVVFGGGTTQSLIASAEAGGCQALSVWANKAGGGLIGYIAGAPAFVNLAWTEQYGDALPQGTPVVLSCASE